ncbi:sugar O-acetyltransferase [Cupriavidus taiwanensis]|uniref:sugar O-acetyltransferase n=1 Tax=Cupriavidus taiwanensis TaxID=164546 RepID=UPI001F01F1B2|nr:sugar O-acetyltransferase [Cupriavidus taiwanensis]
MRVLRRAFPGIAKRVSIAAPIHIDQRGNLSIGSESFLNTDCVILNGAQVSIGANVLVGPGVVFAADGHHIDPLERAADPSAKSKPITIEDNVWIGARAVICPGVTIGANSVIGAGSIVTRDVPPGVLAAGNPCVVKRSVSANQENWTGADGLKRAA